MDITLSSDQISLINRKIETGRFASADEVVGAAFTLMEEKDHMREVHLEDLRAKISEAEEQYRNGNFITISSEEELHEFGLRVMRRGRERLEAGKISE